MQLFLSREVIFFFKLFAERQYRSDQIDSIRSMAISVQILDIFCTKVNDFNRIMFLIFLVSYKKYNGKTRKNTCTAIKQLFLRLFLPSTYARIKQ